MVTGMTPTPVNITTRQLAMMIPVDPSTVRRWVEQGKITPTVITPGGHYRFNADEALAELRASSILDRAA